jgi:hypothetical protein
MDSDEPLDLSTVLLDGLVKRAATTDELKFHRLSKMVNSLLNSRSISTNSKTIRAKDIEKTKIVYRESLV